MFAKHKTVHRCGLKEKRQPRATTEQREKWAELARRVTGPEVAIAHRVHVAADHLTHQQGFNTQTSQNISGKNIAKAAPDAVTGINKPGRYMAAGIRVTGTHR